MDHAYDQMYLEDAMKNLGEMTEYAYYACGVNVGNAFDYFVISGYAKRFQTGDPRVVSGMSGTELFMNVMDKCSAASANEMPKALVRYDTDVYYWMGYIMAFYQWYTARTFKLIFDVIRADDLMRMYPALHTASDERAADSLEDLYRKRRQVCCEPKELLG